MWQVLEGGCDECGQVPPAGVDAVGRVFCHWLRAYVSCSDVLPDELCVKSELSGQILPR